MGTSFVTMIMKVTFFKSATECRRWLEQNHDKVTELWFGFYKKSSGKRGVTYQEALDEASNSDSHRGFSPVD